MFGDWYLALAAYNAGEGKVSRSLRSTKKSDFWSLASTKSLRAETRNYVPAILAATLIAKQPGKYGFDVEPEQPRRHRYRSSIEGQTDLRILARLGDVDPETMRQLNPHLRRGVTPSRRRDRDSRPRGFGNRDRRGLREPSRGGPPRARAAPGRERRVVGCDRRTLRRELDRPSPRPITSGKGATLKQGQELVIPAVVAAAPPVEGTRTGSVTYRVKRGDTLSSIARRYRSSATAIASASGIGIRSPLRVGQRLTIPGRGHRAKPSSTANGTATASAAASAATSSGHAHGAARRDALSHRGQVPGHGRSDLRLEQHLGRWRALSRHASEDPLPARVRRPPRRVITCSDEPRGRSSSASKPAWWTSRSTRAAGSPTSPRSDSPTAAFAKGSIASARR